MVSGLASSTAAVGTQIGRYFSLASLLPSLLFVMWLVALAGGGAPLDTFEPGEAAEALAQWSATKIGLVLAASLLLGFLVHPLLFGTTQLLEGYWGPRPFAVRIATALSLRHRRRQDRLENLASELDREIRAALDELVRAKFGPEAYAALSAPERTKQRMRRRVSPEGEAVHGHIIARDSIRKVLAELPPDADRMLPTRLGNALRQVEDTVGTQYGLDLLTIAPHLVVVAEPARAAYVEESREQMDVSVRLTFFGLLAAVVSTLWLLGAGWWLLVALIPYMFAYTTYRGAVAAAAEWGAALSACVALDRFALYDAMQVKWPETTQVERDRNLSLMKLLQGDRRSSITYVTQSSPPTATG